MSNETAEKAVDVVEIVNEKPYEFRALSSTDVFLMARILNKIGFKQLKACLTGDNISGLIQAATSGEDSSGQESALAAVGVGVALDVAGVILENLPKCEAEIYQLLSNVSGLKMETIMAPGNAVMFFEMVVDFFKKEEFLDFIKVASKLLK